MKKFSFKNNFFSKVNIVSKLLFVFGVIFILTGSICIYVSLSGEVLDDKYIMTNITERIFDGELNLSKGEVRATKSTDYIEKGIYKITYQNHFRNLDTGNLLEEGSYFSIIDIIGNGYDMDANKIEVNGKNYKFNNYIIRTDEGILIEYKNRTIYVEIPETLISKNNTVSIYITLKGRKEHFEYLTTEDSYFNLIPNIDNDFYEKKSSQSYIIDGYGYIKLKKR